jgi:KTSC domain
VNPQEQLQLLEQLMDELINTIQQVVQSGEVLSDEFQSVLAKELEFTFNRIEELKSQFPVEALPAQGQKPPEINQGMPSSNVEGFAYDDKNQRLLVRFLGKYPDRNGPIYGYQGVPKQIFDMFRKGAVPARTDGQNKWGKWWKGKVPSLGASLYTLVKNGPYSYQRLG